MDFAGKTTWKARILLFPFLLTRTDLNFRARRFSYFTSNMVVTFKTNTEVIGTGNEWKSKVKISKIKSDYQREMPGQFIMIATGEWLFVVV